MHIYMWKHDFDACGSICLSYPQQFSMCGVPKCSFYHVPESERCNIVAMAIAKAAQMITELLVLALIQCTIWGLSCPNRDR